MHADPRVPKLNHLQSKRVVTSSQEKSRRSNPLLRLDTSHHAEEASRCLHNRLPSKRQTQQKRPCQTQITNNSREQREAGAHLIKSYDQGRKSGLKTPSPEHITSPYPNPLRRPFHTTKLQRKTSHNPNHTRRQTIIYPKLRAPLRRTSRAERVVSTTEEHDQNYRKTDLKKPPI